MGSGSEKNKFVTGYSNIDIRLGQTPMVGKWKDFQPLSHELVNGTAAEATWDYIVRTFHYLGYNKMLGPRVKYLIYCRDVPIAAISFNRAAWRTGVRDTWLGWNEDGRTALLHHVLNNNRFLILPWIHIKNLASHILSQSLRWLKQDWLRLYGVTPYAVETFVDMRKYAGTCYRAANWSYLGETSGFGKIGRRFVYHGHCKGVFAYLMDRKLIELISRYPRRPDPKSVGWVRDWEMMLGSADWDPNLFEVVGLTEDSITRLKDKFLSYLNQYAECFFGRAQHFNAETYVKGLLSAMPRKSIEPIALLLRGGKAVRLLQMFVKDGQWDDARMKQIYQERVLSVASDPCGMLTVDGSDFPKKGDHSAGVKRQYCGTLGKVDNCQAGVFIGYAGKTGYGLLDSRLYLPSDWFDDAHRILWSACDIPKNTPFRTKPQLAQEMIQELVERHGVHFRWVGCDAAFGGDSAFRDNLPGGIWFFADLSGKNHVFPERPQWSLPDKPARGRASAKLVPSIAPVCVSEIAADESIPWEEVVLMEGAKGPVHASVKCLRVVDVRDDMDGDEVWLYIRKHENGQIKYSLSNAPADIDRKELNRAATLRWPIEQSFEECKGDLGMDHYETRSYVGWHRHMLLVMVAHLFVLEVRQQFQKKTIQANQRTEPAKVKLFSRSRRRLN